MLYTFVNLVRPISRNLSLDNEDKISNRKEKNSSLTTNLCSYRTILHYSDSRDGENG